MKKEKIILSASAIIVGTLVAILILYIYQSTRQIQPSEVKSISVSNPTPTPVSGLFLTIDSPKDETVVTLRSIRVSGKTIPDAKIVILTPTDEQAAVPSDDGSFSTDINLDQDDNIIEITAIAPNGEIVKVRRVVSYSTQDF